MTQHSLFSDQAPSTSRVSPSLGVLIILVMLLAIAAFVLWPERALYGAVVVGIGAGALVATIVMLRLTGALIISATDARRRTLQRLVDLDGDAAAYTTTDGQVLAANTRFKRLINHAPGEIWRNLERVFDRDELAMVDYRVVVDQAKTGVAVSREITVGRGDALRAWRLQAMPSRSSGMTHWRLADVSERWRLTRELQAERERLMEFLDIGATGLFALDAAGHFTFVNRAFADQLGMTPDSLLSGNARWHDILLEPPEDVAPFEVAKPGETRFSGLIKVRHSDGRQIRVVLDHDILHGPEGEVHTRSVLRPIANAGEDNAVLFHRVFDDAPIGIALLSDDGHVEHSNDVFRRLFNLSADRNDRPAVYDLLDADSAQQLQTAVQALVIGGERLGPLEMVRKGQETSADLQIFGRRLSDDDGRIRGVILHAIDISEQKAIEGQFVQAQKMRAVGELAGGVAHDFNNLLTAMLGYADLLLQRHRPGDPSFNDIMQIRQNANRAADLVRQLLAFGRRQTLRPRVLSTTDVISDFTHMLSRLIGEGIELKQSHDPELWLIRADRGQLEQVVMNLVVNARDAMEGKGDLHLVTENVTLTEEKEAVTEEIPPGDYVRLSVQDTGKGMEPKVLERIFEPFFSTKAPGKGTGLGLSMVYGIVRQTGGFIDVETEKGRGTRFDIYLPRHHALPSQEPAAEKVEVPAPVADLTGAGTVMLVEDEDGVRKFACRALENKGYNVLGAGTAEEALDMLSDPDLGVDLLISDVVMPGMDGPAFVREALKDRPHLKVVFISGYAEEHLRDEIGESLEASFLPKPFSLKALAETVKEMLGPAPGN